MLSRRTVLGFSIVFSVAVHGLLLAAAPHVTILQPTPVTAEYLRMFRVRLQEPQPEPPEGATASTELASRAASVEGMTKREDEELKLNDRVLDKGVETARLAERAATEAIDRQYDLVQDIDQLQKVDAKIIEIAQKDARKDIEVARRFVRPSPERILEENEFPVLRGQADDDQGAEQIRLAPPVGSTLREPAPAPDNIVSAKTPSAPPREEDVLKPEVVEPKAPTLPIEHAVMHQPAVEQARGESSYEFIDDLVNIGIDAYMPSGEKQGYFRLQIVPKGNESIEVLPKDVTFIVDASNSIPQHKLDSTTRGAVQILDRLRPQDQFNVVAFRDNPTVFRQARVPATQENKTAARDFLTKLQSRGQTDVYQGIRAVLDERPRPGVPGVVLVMTDGRPTTGVRDGRTIINSLTEENLQGNTIFAYGGGNTVNRYLLDLLAYRNKGESFVSERVTDIDRDLPKFFGDVNDPILVSLQSDYGRIDEQDVFPKEIPDFYRGRAVTVYGRFDPEKDKDFSMRLTGAAGNRRKELVFRADLSKASSGDKQIARNWAFQKIYYLIGEICRVGEKPELLDEVRRLSGEYGIKTSYSE